MAIQALRLAGAGVVAALIAFVPPLQPITHVVWMLFNLVARDAIAASNVGWLEGFVVSSMPYLFVGSVLLSIGYSTVFAAERFFSR